MSDAQTAEIDSFSAGVPESIKKIQARLCELFIGSEQIDRDSQAGRCFGPLLAALGWAGEARHLQESLPHFDEVRTINDVRAVLSRLNLDTYPVKRAMQDLGAEMMPCLFLAQNGNLYVVIEREARHSLLVFSADENAFHDVDPKEVGEGTAYYIRPTDFEGSRRYFERRGWMQSLFVKFRRTFLNLFILTFIINMLALAVPLYVMNVYDKAVGAKSTLTLGYLLAGVVIVLIADLFLRSVRARYLAYLGSRVECIVTTGAFEKLLHLPLGMLETAPIGSQVTRFKQFESVREVFSGSLAATVLDLPFLIVFLITIFILSGPVGFIPVGLILIYAVMAFITVPLLRLRVRSAGDTKSATRNFVMEFISKRDTIRDTGAEDVWLERYRDIAGRTLIAQFRAQKLSMTIQTVSQLLVVVAGGATVGLGTLMVLDGTMSAGALIAVMTLVWRVLSPLQAVFLSLNRIGQTRESFDQINSLMRLQTERQPGELPTFFRKFKGQITIRNCGFRFASGAEPAIRGIDLNISPGEFVAITGASGSGKSTLLKILARLYQPQAGGVLFDRIDLRQLDVAEVRHTIGFLPDRPNYFYGTVAQNFYLACPTATRDDMLEALKMVGAGRCLEQIPDLLDLRMTNKVVRDFPEGLLQQIYIAQAIIKNAPIYLLDEPGSTLDAEGDKQLMELFQKLRGNSTLVIVTHRPSHMKLADRVVVLDHGAVVGQGKPDEILPALYRKQQGVLANS